MSSENDGARRDWRGQGKNRRRQDGSMAPLKTESLDPIFKASRETSRVAIIGRPNVGKSTLFNYLTETRKAVVKNQPGVTRDILIEPGEIWGTKFDVIDTGGLTEAKDTFSKLIREQVLEFLQSVDHLIVVFDGRVGLTPEDKDIARIAVEAGKPFLAVINKVDSNQDAESSMYEFYELGFENMVSASFERRFGMDAVLEWIVAQIERTEHTVRDGLTLAMVGKPNVGKSSLCNRLLGEKRLLVSDIAGTTVDAVDSELVYQDRKYVLIDTAGLRRSARREEDVEILSAFKTRDAIRRADVIMLVVDGNEGPTAQDAKILEKILEAHRAVILVSNKVDLAEENIPEYRSWFRARVEREMHFFKDIPIAFVSAKTGRGLKELFDTVVSTEAKLTKRIKTRDLNDFFVNVIRQAPAPVWNTQNVKFYYLTQTNQQPPAFIAFANHPEGVTASYRRFLQKRLQDEFDLNGMPIRIFVMSGTHGRNRRRRTHDEQGSPDEVESNASADTDSGDFIPSSEVMEYDLSGEEGGYVYDSNYDDESDDDSSVDHKE